MGTLTLTFTLTLTLHSHTAKSKLTLGTLFMLGTLAALKHS